MYLEVYRTEDEYGPVVVLDKGDKRLLSFDSNLQQSCIYLNKPYYLVHEYTQIMILGLLFTDAKNMTILGLGGGGLAHFLHYFFPQSVTRVVELRQSVIDVAYQWFNLPKKANLKVICDEAGHYIKNHKPAKIDILFSDLYEAQGMAGVQAQAEFIKQCYQTLSDNGWLVVNLHGKPESELAIMDVIRATYADLYLCEVFSGNWILFCGKSELQFDKLEFEQRAREFIKHVDMPLMYYFKLLKKI